MRCVVSGCNRPPIAEVEITSMMKKNSNGVEEVMELKKPVKVFACSSHVVAIVRGDQLRFAVPSEESN